MKVAHITVALATALALTAGAALVAAQPPDKVTVCHNLEDTGEDIEVDHDHAPFVPEHDHDVYEGTTIEVVEPALGAHLAHGDLQLDDGCLGGHTVTIEGTTLHLHDADGDGTPEYIAERPY